ncbi:hypothetical protein OIU84_022507 [Salix udensis]|uniref:Survival Motor Neuron Gemin2-binding domain-containing protein n=1 Tax=Salix udensis TaxID=889485 RepID=A0AAD6KNR3_9ROSI|nr:hypothetical protein OIU84_022507 [Salix udensis]
MGKEGELWDDSALINAFDDAIFKYKKMHGKKRILDKSSDGGEFGGGTDDENASAVTGVDERWQMRAAMLHRILSQNWERPKNLAPAKLKNCVDSLGPGPYIDPSNGGAHAQNSQWLFWLHALHSHLVHLGGTSLGKACADSSPMMNPGKSFPPIDDDIVKTAMDAAERAMSSMTMNASAVKSDIEGKHGFF